MPQQDWYRIKEILGRALDLEQVEHAAFLDRACADDPESRARVERLLGALERPLPWLGKPVFEAAPDLLIPNAPSAAEGHRIGPFEILRELGRGGMGVVYLARRADDQYHQRVAIKLIRGDMATESIKRRFRQERQILASLEHPNIARLLGGDVTSEGMPYLIMEHVEGEPIDAYCQRFDLSITARLELFRNVCSAVQYAHRSLVVHCDLTPNNVLVTRQGVPKLLDFGISRLLAADFVPRLLAGTAAGRWRMTPEFASPEQIRGQRLTAASDIYSLGVMLCRLLTGRPPYRFEARALQEIQRVICEQEPERPSMIVASPRCEAEHASAGPPGRSPRGLRRRLSGDLDSIVLMALHKDPGGRYISVEQLSQDLQRHLAGLPVIARNATVLYRTEKFLRRHRLGLAATMIVIATLVAGILIANLERGRAQRERARAERESERAEAVTEFLVGLVMDTDSAREFSAGSLLATPAAEEARRLILDEGARRVRAELTDQPDVQAALMQHLGNSYRNLGRYQKAEGLLEASWQIRVHTFGQNSLQAATSLDSLCLLRLNQGDLARAEARCNEGLAIRRAAADPSPLLLAESQNSLALVLREQGFLDEAEGLLQRSLRIRRDQLPDRHRAVTTSLNNLAVVLREKGNHADAEPLLREVLARKLERYGAQHLQIVNSRLNLASALQDQKDYAEAESLYRQALELGRILFDEEHPLIATVHHNLGKLFVDLGRYTEARESLEAALRIDHQLYGDDHHDVAGHLNSLGIVAFHQGRFEEAAVFLSRALEIYRRTLGEAHPHFRDTLFSLASLWLGQGLDHQARSLLDEALERWRQSPPQEGWAMPQAATMLGGSLLRAHQLTVAEPLLREGFEGLRTAVGTEDRLTQAALGQLLDLYETAGKKADAERYRVFSISRSAKRER